MALSTRLLDIGVGAAALASASFALGCGYCIEDKVAATYDHAVVARAQTRGHDIAFFALEGTLAPGDRERRALERLAERAPGVDSGSVRVSTQSASLSVAFDPARVTLGKLQNALQSVLARRGLTVQPLQVIANREDSHAPGHP